MIPKIIHYCWFGGNPLPELAEKCIASWKKYCPDYELMLWNETNFDVNIVPFTSQAFKVKKWAFVSDYVRAYVVYNHGGIYLDTDVELLKPFSDDMLKNICFSGFENEKNIAPGLVFAGEKRCIIAKELMDFYSSYNFINKNGELFNTVIPKILSDILLKYGLKRNNTFQKLDVITVYPTEYFCPKDYRTGIVSITNNTYSIHHYFASWHSEDTLKLIHERWDFFARYNNDKFVMDLVEQHEKLINDFKNNNCNSMSLKKLYKIVIKRTLKKLVAIISGFFNNKKSKYK